MTISFCSASLADMLGFNRSSRSSFPLPIISIHGESNIQCGLLPGVVMSDLCSVHTVNMPPLYVIESVPVNTSDIIAGQHVSEYSHLRHLQLPDISGNVEIMIGANVPQALEPLEVIPAPKEFQPYAVRTRLGWVVCGPRPSGSGINSVNRVSIGQGKLMDETLIRAFDREFQALSSHGLEMSYDDKKWVQEAADGCVLVDDKYQVPLPLDDLDRVLPDSLTFARNRVFGIGKRLWRDDVLKQGYVKFMEDMIRNGYAQVAPEVPDGPVWYIPHFAVKHPKKPTKVRVVFDCAAKVNGLCLNDLLRSGPDLMNVPLDVLLRFRLGRVAYTGDIEAMFYQVAPECQRDILRFFWWLNGDLTGEPVAYGMYVHLFGASSSPSIANFVLRHTAEQGREKYSERACDSVFHQFYVDDCLYSCDNVGELISIAKEVQGICRDGGFNFTKLMSPISSFMTSFPEEFLAVDPQDIPVVKEALGVLHCKMRYVPYWTIWHLRRYLSVPISDHIFHKFHVALLKHVVSPQPLTYTKDSIPSKSQTIW